MVPSSGLPSKIVLTQQCRQRCASAIAAGSVVADFDFGYAGAPFEGQHGYGLAVDVEIVERHGVPLKQFDFDDGLRVLTTSQIFVNAHRRAFAVADAVDDETRSEHAVATGEDAGGRRHQRLRVDGDQTAWRQLDFVFRRRKSRRGACPIAMMMVSHSIWVSLLS